jgi:membrane protein DedA with SNARE-associated domain
MAVESLILQLSQWFGYVVQTFGYPGIFFINLVGSASIILPLPSVIIVFASGAILNPWLVGLSSAAGAALVELTGYVLGFGSRQVIEGKHKKLLERTKKWIEKHGAFAIIVLFAVTPLPDDVVGILAGIIKYDVKRFLLATFVGKLVMMTAVAWGGFYGSQWVLAFFGL